MENMSAQDYQVLQQLTEVLNKTLDDAESAPTPASRPDGVSTLLLTEIRRLRAMFGVEVAHYAALIKSKHGKDGDNQAAVDMPITFRLFLPKDGIEPPPPVGVIKRVIPLPPTTYCYYDQVVNIAAEDMVREIFEAQLLEGIKDARH